MFRQLIRFLLTCSGLISLAPHAFATTVSIHTDDARATLLAIQNPSLSHAEAMTIAKMHGNLGVVRKLQEFKIPSTPESFANALYNCAHGQKVMEVAETAIGLDRVKPKVPQLLALLQEIEANPKTFQKAIEQRISMFTPTEADIHLEGYVVAAGDGGGYAFGDTDFFLNIGISDDFIIAKDVTTHELYHAVQGAYAPEREMKIWSKHGRSQEACANVEHLFANLYEEGSARYVEDISLLSQSHSEAAKRILTDLADSISRVHTSASLLDMSVASLDASDPVPFDNIYDVGFLGHGELYGIGYVMAKAIVESDGPQGLVTLLKQPPNRFVLHYAELPKYGADTDHPRLGPNTITAANQLLSGCR
jgi:hypothetical protein